jgi:hypothetical protein
MIDRVYEGARLFLDNYNYVLSNVFIFDWESDVFGLSKSGYAVEIEVKVSRSDFFADFKKGKHITFTGCKLGHLGNYNNVPHKFYFACPKGLIKSYEVPDYAGLIYVNTGYADFEVIKRAPFMHKTKLDLTNKLLSKYYHNSLNTRSRLNGLIYKVKTEYDENNTLVELKQILKLLK